MEYPCNAHMEMHFYYCALHIPICDDLIIVSTTFVYIIYVLRVGGFPTYTFVVYLNKRSNKKDKFLISKTPLCIHTIDT